MTRPHLHLVDTHTGQVDESVCLGCVELSKKVAHLAGELTKLRNQQAEVERRHPLDAQIMEVCTFHKQLLSPKWTIVRNKGAYKDVGDRLRDIDAETGQPAFSVLHLRAASVGMSMSDWCRKRGIKSASWLFGSTRHVQWMLEDMVGFKREFGVSALEIVDELGRGGYEHLAAVCECGHIRLEHEKERPMEGLWQPPCLVHGCACPGYMTAPLWEQVRWAAEREREAA